MNRATILRDEQPIKLREKRYPPPEYIIQFPTVEECDFDRRFLFDEYVAISHRYDLKRVSLKS